MTTAVVVDVDGTVCFDGHTLSPAVADALRFVRDRTRLVFASARPLRDLLPVLPDDLAEVDLIGGNGAFHRAPDGEVSVRGFSAETRRDLDALIAAHDLGALLDGPWDYSYSGPADHMLRARIDPARLARHVEAHTLPHYAKALLFTTSAAVIAELSVLPVAFSVHPVENAIDVAPHGVTKASAVAALGFTDVIAFGNDANDVPLLRAARVSVRVGSHPGLDFASRTTTEAGVAGVLREIAGSAPF